MAGNAGHKFMMGHPEIDTHSHHQTKNNRTQTRASNKHRLLCGWGGCLVTKEQSPEQAGCRERAVCGGRVWLCGPRVRAEVPPFTGENSLQNPKFLHETIFTKKKWKKEKAGIDSDPLKSKA